MKTPASILPILRINAAQENNFKDLIERHLHLVRSAVIELNSGCPATLKPTTSIARG